MYKKNNITLEFVDTKDQLAYIFAKPLNEDWFIDIRRKVAVISFWNDIAYAHMT